MRGGYFGQLLRVDLTSGESAVEPLHDAYLRRFIGGNGFAIDILFREQAGKVNPLSPENMLVLATGPWNGTPIPGSSRACIATKSPLTGIFYDSTFGGRFPTTLKRTGFDAVIITGAAKEPVALVIGEDGAEIRPAGHLAGRTIKDTVMAIHELEGTRADVLAIGPAGENKVRFAAAGHYWQNREGFAGRGGIGAVMGVKGLKAIVVNGTKRTPVADPGALDAFLKSHRAEVRRGTEGLTEYGTAVLANFLNKMGALASRAMAADTWDKADRISGERLRAEFVTRNTTCFVCPVACGKDVEIKEGKYAGTHAKSPEWETIYAFGPLLDNDEVEVIVKAGELCDQLGMDTITMGVTVVFAYECFERGLLDEDDVGMPLRFGDPEPVLELIRRTAVRDHIGEILAEGSARMAARLGPEAEKLLLTVKGLEIPGHSPRALKGMSIGYATGTRGGSHHDTRPTPFYIGTEDRFDEANAPRFAMRSQNFTAVGDSLVQCRFVSERGGYGLFIDETYAELMRYVTGWDWTAEEIEEVGERICNLERCFNVREGIRRADDRLPYKVMNYPIPDGPSKGMYCPELELTALLDKYYRLRGWGPDGVPMRQTLERLGLADAAATLETISA